MLDGVILKEAAVDSEILTNSLASSMLPMQNNTTQPLVRRLAVGAADGSAVGTAIFSAAYKTGGTATTMRNVSNANSRD